MARFNAETVDNYGGKGGTGYFSLKGDGDSAVVRFLYNDIDDVEGYAVHEVEIDGKKRYVNCLREYNQPVDDCPFCRDKRYQVAKLFVPVYNEDEQKVQVWERGKKFFQKISSICARYNKAPIVSQTFEIVRNGKPGDKQTTYEIYRTDEPADGAKLEDFDAPDILGGVVLDKSADDMEFYIANDYFPPEDDGVSNRRTERDRNRDRRDEEEEIRPRRGYDSARSRRTPAREDVL